MENMKVKLVGNGALLIHSNKAANPLSKEAKIMKELQKKRGKTDADYAILSRQEWEAGLYLYEGVAVMPAQNIEKTFLLGARKSKNGKQFESGVFLEEDFCPLSYNGPKIKTSNTNGAFPDSELDKFYEHHNWKEMVRVSTQQILRTRPIFHDWSCNANILFDGNIINERTLLSCIQDAGRLIGLCEKRPRLGRFNVEVVK